MPTIARSIYLDSAFGTIQELPRAGTALEHPLVYDSIARELKSMAESGTVEIVREHVRQAGDETLIDRLQFRRVR